MKKRVLDKIAIILCVYVFVLEIPIYTAFLTNIVYGSHFFSQYFTFYGAYIASLLLFALSVLFLATGYKNRTISGAVDVLLSFFSLCSIFQLIVEIVPDSGVSMSVVLMALKLTAFALFGMFSLFQVEKFKKTFISAFLAIELVGLVIVLVGIFSKPNYYFSALGQWLPNFLHDLIAVPALFVYGIYKIKRIGEKGEENEDSAESEKSEKVEIKRKIHIRYGYLIVGATFLIVSILNYDREHPFYLFAPFIFCLVNVLLDLFFGEGFEDENGKISYPIIFRKSAYGIAITINYLAFIGFAYYLGEDGANWGGLILIPILISILLSKIVFAFIQRVGIIFGLLIILLAPVFFWFLGLYIFSI